MFSWSQQWALKTYMQDWLNWQFTSMEATTNNVHVGRDWLMQMGAGAADSGVTIQYCMSLSRHILQSLEIPAVTQVINSFILSHLCKADKILTLKSPRVMMT